MTRFIHCADIHLGFEQYGLREREEDFALAFNRVVDYACNEGVDFVLIAGDLMHKASQSDARALLFATDSLDRLKRAGIPALAIEGNHELQQKVNAVSFPQYLNQFDFLHLLDVQRDEFQRLHLSPWDSESRAGSYFDIGESRIFGIRYMGAQTPQVLEEIVPFIYRGDAKHVIMMLHAGIEGEVPHMHGGLTMGQLHPLREKVDYIALGHVHKRLEREGWIYNPGSTETCSMEEVGHEWPHGFFSVTLEEVGTRVTPHPTSIRSFVRIQVGIEGAAHPDEVLSRARSVIASRTDLEDGAVIEVTLTGVTPFNRHEIPEEAIRAAIGTRCTPLSVRVRYSVSANAVSLDTARHSGRSEMEREIVEEILRNAPGYERQAKRWATIALEVKQMVQEGRPPAAIAEHVKAGREAIEREGRLVQPPPGAETDDPVVEPVAEPVSSRQLGLPV